MHQPLLNVPNNMSYSFGIWDQHIALKLAVKEYGFIFQLNNAISASITVDLAALNIALPKETMKVLGKVFLFISSYLIAEQKEATYVLNR